MQLWESLSACSSSIYPYRIDTRDGCTHLVIKNADVSDAGWYQCSAVSVAGSATSRAKVAVEPPAQPKPQEFRIVIPKKPTKV